MFFKTLSIPPLETIYEESGSFVESRENSQYDLNDRTVNGLISARSIPSVDVERQRANEINKKPPVEVLFRNGTKRFIHPITSPTMIMNRRNFFPSSEENLSSKNKFRTKPLVITIITAEDLSQADIASTATPSSSESDFLHSQTNSPFIPVKSLEELSERSSTVSLVTNSQRDSTPNQRQHSNTPISIQTISTNNENEKKLTLNSISSEKTTNQLVPSQPPPPPTTTTIVHTNTSGAFRPLFKAIPFNIQPIPTKPREPSVLPEKSSQPVPQQITSYRTHYQPNITFVSYQPTRPQNFIISTEKNIKITSNLQSLLQTNYPPYSSQYSSHINQPSSNYPWHTVTSNSFYDIPRLSSKYSRVPLHITLPVSQVQNQSLVRKHNPMLEKRLLNAGLLPETVALYERIIDVAEYR